MLTLSELLFFQTNPIDEMGLFIRGHVFFLKAKGLNDNGYLLTNQFDYNDRFEISQTGHLVKLASALVNKAIYYIQSIRLIK